MKKVILALLLFATISSIQAQTKEELKALKKEKTDSIAALKAKEDAIQAEIDALPGWRLKATGTIGGSVSGFNNWYAKSSPNSSVGNFGINVNAFADLIEEKYFWKNAMNVNIGWVKFDDKDDPDDSDDYEVATDVFNISSLYGYKVSKKLSAGCVFVCCLFIQSPQWNAAPDRLRKDYCRMTKTNRRDCWRPHPAVLSHLSDVRFFHHPDRHF